MNAKNHLLRGIVGALLLQALTAACAPAPSTAAPAPATVATQPAATATSAGKLLSQASDIVGVWETFSPHCTPGYMLIRPDGTYTWSCSRDGSDGLSGTYRFDGSDFVILNDICGAEGRFQVYGQGSGPTGKALVFKLVKDDCDADVNALTSQVVTWVSALP